MTTVSRRKRAMSEPRQLDEISQSIGKLIGQVEGIEKYIHGERHAVNNLSQKVDALGVNIMRDIAAVEARIDEKIEAMKARMADLEQDRAQRQGGMSVVQAILKSPLIGWLVGGALAVWAILNGRPPQ